MKIRIKEKWIWNSHGALGLRTRSVQSAAVSCQHVLPSAPSFHRSYINRPLQQRRVFWNRHYTPQTCATHNAPWRHNVYMSRNGWG